MPLLPRGPGAELTRFRMYPRQLDSGRISSAPTLAVLLSLVSLLSLLLVPPALDAQESGVVAAADVASGDVSLLDTTCWGVAARMSMGGEVHQLTPAPGRPRAYVAHSVRPAVPPGDREGESGPAPPASPADEGSAAAVGAVTVLDLAERRTAGRFFLGRTGAITDVWSGHEGSRIWVAAERNGRILTLEASTGELLMQWTIGTTSPQSGAVSRDDRYLFVTNREAGTLTVIDRVTVAANTVSLDHGVGSVAVGPEGEAWVADRDGDRMWIVDGRTEEVLGELSSGGSVPVQLERRPKAGEMWVLHAASGDLQIFDAGSYRRAGSVQLPGRPRALRFSADGRRALVTVPDAGLVVTVDAVNRRVLDSARVPLKPGVLGWFSCPEGRCGSDAARWTKGGTGLPGEHWSEADLVGDLWCGA